MKILKQDRKNGFIEVFPEILDDLWHLSHIISRGDHISSKTTRRIQDTTGDKLRSDRGVKKTFFLGLKVQNISFHVFTGKLRITGIITKGPEEIIPLGSHHTIEVKLNNPLKINKFKWSKWDIERLEDAIEASKKLSAIIIVLEDDIANIGLIRQFGIEYYGPIIGNIPGKRVIDKNRPKIVLNFYKTIIDSILKFDSIETIILAGPGFYKNDFLKYLKDKHNELAKKSIVENTGAGGRAGIHEVLKKGIVEKTTSENRIAYEMANVDFLLTKIATEPGKVVYGKKETVDAAYAGAIEKLLIVDKIIARENLEKIMNLVENTKGEIMIISSEHDGGKQLESLGGIGAILRYNIS